MIKYSKHGDIIILKLVFIFHFMYLFLERGGGREKHQGVVASCVPPTGNLAHNPGTCPDWESNQRPFGLQTHPQSTELHQPGLIFIF